MTSRATDFLRYNTAVAIVNQVGMWPHESSGANPIILRWKQGTRVVVCIRVRRAASTNNVQVTVGGKIRHASHQDVAANSPVWAGVLGEVRRALNLASG